MYLVFLYFLAPELIKKNAGSATLNSRIWICALHDIMLKNPSKWIRPPQTNYVPHHINNRCIGNFMYMSVSGPLPPHLIRVGPIEIWLKTLQSGLFQNDEKGHSEPDLNPCSNRGFES